MGKNKIGMSFTKGTESAFKHLFQGEIDLALRTSQDALEIARDSGGSYVKGMAYSSYGAACFFKGNYAEAETHLLKGLDRSRQNTMTAWEAWAGRKQKATAACSNTTTISGFRPPRGGPAYISPKC